MSESLEKANLVRRWMSLACSDLAYARKSLGLGEQFNDKICFHSQQAAEKALKALLIALDVRPPRTHDIRALVALVSNAFPDLLDALTPVVDLTDYAVEIRYPDEWYVPKTAETERAIELAHKAIMVVDARLISMGYCVSRHT